MLRAALRRVLMSCLVCMGALLTVTIVAKPAFSQELLLNRSFETPVAPQNGNNFYISISNWTLTNLTAPVPQPVNIVRPFPGYGNNALATPPSGGNQYLDINSAGGLVNQVVTIPRDGNIDFSAWFSVREGSRALTTTINIRNASGTIVAAASVSHLATDAIGVWKQASAVNIPVRAGSYTLEIVLDDYANADLASLVFKPGLTVTKTSAVFSDGISAANPKAIPGSFIDYTLGVSNPAAVTGANPVPGYDVTSSSLLLNDTTPANTELFVGNLGGGGTGPAAFDPGTTALGYNFVSLASTADGIEFSNNNGSSWTYTPVPDAAGFDAAVTNVRLRPSGIMAAGTNFSFRIRYRVK